ncbi:hypothetical protein BDW75DRAFT_228315 [Aspergillus navahoensis]
MSACGEGSPNCHFNCPPGSKWYACPDEPRFIGCCASAPCTNATSSVCPAPDLRSASFDGAVFDNITPNTCINSLPENFYTCNFTDPPFLGCCGINPCALGSCPLEELIPAAWSSSRQYNLFLDARIVNSTSHLSSGAIAGIAIGGVAALAAILIALFFLLRWRQRRKSRSASSERPRKTSSSDYGMYSLRPWEG